MEEKRKSPRAVLATKVQTQSNGYSFLAVGEDISEGGMHIHTANPRPAGQVVELEFTLPGTEQVIHARATVRYLVPSTSMGVEFEGLEPDVVAAIRHFVESVATQQAPHSATG